MAATFSPPKNPQAPYQVDGSPRLLSPQLGTGDPSFVPDGQNVTLHSVTLKFDPLDESDFVTIDNFLTSNLGQPFFYTLMDETEPRLWLMMSRVRRGSETTWGVEVSLTEQPIL